MMPPEELMDKIVKYSTLGLRTLGYLSIAFMFFEGSISLLVADIITIFYDESH
jgi:hypothetical protein